MSKNTPRSILEGPLTHYLFIILVVSFFLRIWGIWNIEQTDEFNEVFEALKVDSGTLNLERWNKKALIYILAIEYAIFFGIGWLLGIYASVSDFAGRIAIDMTPLFLLGRTTSALLGSGIVYLTYRVGKELFTEGVGLLAALFLCFNAVHVEHSHLVLVDILMTAMVTWSFYFSCMILKRGEKKYYFWAGLCAGVAIVAKIPSIFICLSILTAHVLFHLDKSKGFIYILRQTGLLYAGMALLAGAIVGNPAILLGIGKYLSWLKMVMGAYQGKEDLVDFWTPINGYSFYLNSIIEQMGSPLFLLILAGLILYVLRKDSRGILLISFTLPFFIFMANSKWVLTHRYMIPVYPFLAVLAASFLPVIQRRFLGPNRILLVSILILLLVVPIKNVLFFNLSLLHKNTRHEAKDWIEKNIPPGSKILIDSGRTINTYSPPIFGSKENILEMINNLENLKEGETFDDSRIVDSRSVMYYQLLLKNMPRITYNLTSTELGKKAKSIQYYRQNGYQYAVTSSYIAWRAFTPIWADKYPAASAFYKNVDKELLKIAEFKPSRTRSGPDINIYKFGD